MTYHRAINYGSVLQAYALCTYLQKEGYRAEIIDYHTTAQDTLYHMFQPWDSPMDCVRNAYTALHYHSEKKKREKFSAFLQRYVPISTESFQENTDMSRVGEAYDHYICGSDQIWNPHCADFSPAYLLDFVRDKSRCIAYAPSMGTDSLDEKYIPLFQKEISPFHRLSMREKSGAAYLSQYIGRELAHVSDPVLLLSHGEWEALAAERPIKGKYIFCYFIGNVPAMREFAVSMRKRTKYPLVVVDMSLRNVLFINHKRYSAGPLDFLSLIRHCEYVCTNSYHAVMFSLIFHKRFWVFTDLRAGSTKSRIDGITDAAGFSHRVLHRMKALPMDATEEMDFRESDRVLCKLAQKSKAFLREALSEGKGGEPV